MREVLGYVLKDPADSGSIISPYRDDDSVRRIDTIDGVADPFVRTQLGLAREAVSHAVHTSKGPSDEEFQRLAYWAKEAGFDVKSENFRDPREHYPI